MKKDGRSSPRLRVDKVAAAVGAQRIEDIAKITDGRATGMNRWMEKCKICASHDRQAMNESILRGMTYPQFCEKWGGDLGTLHQYHRHRRWHLFDQIKALLAVDNSYKMVKISRFPFDGTGREQADWVTRQLAYNLERMRFGKVLTEDVAKHNQDIRQWCQLILRGIVVRDRLTSEKDVTHSLDEDSDKEILARAAEYMNERAREDAEDDAGQSGGPESDGSAAPSETRPAADNADAAFSDIPAERVVDFGSDDAPTDGNASPAQ